MSIIDGQGLIIWEGGLFLPGSDLLRRVQWAFAQIRAAGGTIFLDEAGRPFGVAGDANVANAWQTASGRSTVWFQWGRYLRGETPSAADPRSGNVLASEHTQGLATDTNAPTIFDMTLRAQFFRQAGMVQTIPSESWHFAIRGNPLVDISTSTASNGATPISNRTDDDEMFSKEGQDYLQGMKAEILSGVRREARGRLFYCPTPPAGLPQYVIIFVQRDPGEGNVLYLNDGENQAKVARERYYQTDDTVAQAKAAAITDPNQYQTLINLALGKDSAFTNAAAKK